MSIQELVRELNKDYLDTEDIMQRLGVCRSSASTIMGNIRRWARDRGTIRLDMEGRVHLMDFAEYYRLPPERYSIQIKIMEDKNG